MLNTVPRMGMKVCGPSCDGSSETHRGSITALRLDRSSDPTDLLRYNEVQVTWVNGKSEWVATSTLSVSPNQNAPQGEPSYPKPRLRRRHAPKVDSAVERWRKDRRRVMKTIVIGDIESMAIACENQMKVAVNQSSFDNWKANAELLRLAVEVLTETKREKRRPRP